MLGPVTSDQLRGEEDSRLRIPEHYLECQNALTLSHNPEYLVKSLSVDFFITFAQLPPADGEKLRIWRNFGGPTEKLPFPRAV